MDINYLLKREQISLMQAGRANGVEAQMAHLELARAYAKRLRHSAYPHAGMTVELGKA